MISAVQRLAGAVLLLITICFATTSFAIDPQAVRYYEDAVERFSSGDLKGAELQLKNSLTLDPSQLSARILMGRVQLGLGNAKQAEEELLLVNKLGADPMLIALPLAKARNQSGKHQENIDSLVPTEFPIDQQPDVWVELGNARLLGGDPQGAKMAFEQALSIQPIHEGGTLGLARIPLQQRKFAEAERLATAAIADFPDSADALFLQASALHGQGKSTAAAEAYARARDIDPDHSIAGLGEATALLDANQTDRAIALLGALRESYPWMPEAPYLQHQALKKLGRNEEAAAALSAATDLLARVDPTGVTNSPGLLQLIGSVAYANGQLERAYQALSRYIQTRPGDIKGRKLLARVSLGMDNPADAKRALVPLVTAGQADAETLGLLGDATAKTGDYVTAESYYRDAIANYRGGPALVGRLGAIQYRQGQRDKALATLHDLISEGPTDNIKGISLYTAMLYFAEGQLAEAAAITDRLVVQQPENLLVLNLQAALAIAMGDRAEAHSMLNALLAKAPSFGPARYNLAKLYMLEGEYIESQSILEKMLSEDANDSRAKQEMARLAAAMGDRRLAIQRYEAIRQIDSKALIPSVELIDLYLAEERWGDAMNTASALTRALPNNFLALETLARVQLRRNETKEARATLRKTAQLAGYDTRKLMQVAQLQQASGAYEDAAWTLSTILAERPAATSVRRALADTQFRQGKLQAALQEVERLLADTPDDLFALSLLGDIQLAQGQPDLAAATFSRVLQKDQRPNILVSHFRARTLAGQSEDALAELAAWQDAHPENPLVLRELAERYHQLGQVELALAYYQKLIAVRPNEPLVHNNLANLLMGLDNERAFKSARQAHQLDPENPAILDTYGWALVQVGDLDQGIAMLREAAARAGSSAIIRYHLGVALGEFGSNREAKRQLQHALRLSNDAAWSKDAMSRIDRLH